MTENDLKRLLWGAMLLAMALVLLALIVVIAITMTINVQYSEGVRNQTAQVVLPAIEALKWIGTAAAIGAGFGVIGLIGAWFVTRRQG